MKFEDCQNRKQWDDFITSHPEANFLQSWDFYEFHLARGRQITRRIAVSAKGNVRAAYAGVVETAKRGKHLAIAGGPICDWQNAQLTDSLFQDIAAEGRRLGCSFVRVRPQLEINQPVPDGQGRSVLPAALFRAHGFRPAPLFLSVEYAGILDLHQSESEILAHASQGLRRKLRKAEKAGIRIEKSTDPVIIHEFYQIQLQTARRHGFYAFSEDFLTKQFAAFAPNGEAVMYSAKQGEETLAQNFMIFYGNEASYHYGVSSELGTRISAAPLLHLEAMRDARARGIGRYNFWGIVGLNEKKHRFYGVSEFKRSFGVTELRYLPAQDLVLRKFAYLKTYLIESIRKKLRHLG